MRCNGSNWAVYSPGSWDGFRNDLWALWAGVIMRLEHHLVGGYVRYISPHIIIIIIIMIMIRFVARTYPPCWVLKAWIQKHRGKPLLFHDKCPGFFYVHYTTHGTYSFTSHPKDEAIMVKCLAQGHKRRDRPGRDLNPHFGNTRTWVQCTRPLGHNTPQCL